MKTLLTTTAIVAMTAMPLAAQQSGNAQGGSGQQTEQMQPGAQEMRISNLLDATVYMPQSGDQGGSQGDGQQQ